MMAGDSSTVTATPLEAFLTKIESDPSLFEALKSKRITTIRKLFQMTPAYIDTSILPALKYDTAELDVKFLKRLLPAHHKRMRLTKVFPTYKTMSLAEIDELIAEHEAQEHESASVASGQVTASSMPPATTKTHATKRYLDAYSDCAFPQVPVGAKAMKDFKINFINISRSMKLDYLFQSSFTRPSLDDPKYASFEEDNTFIFSVLIKVTRKHEVLNLINTEKFMNDGIEAWAYLLKWYDVDCTEECVTALSLESYTHYNCPKFTKGHVIHLFLTFHIT